MMFNSRHGRIGVTALLCYSVFELVGPVAEVFGQIAGGAGFAFCLVSLEFAVLFVEDVSFHKYGRWSDIGIAVMATIAENIGYRQLHASRRLQGSFSALWGAEPEEGEMKRTVFETEF
jgi:hypothetical protein|tara:strand:- start:545 stop:898 length:354 start_codon:yes stop_codon:yes gene_type:complete